MSNSGLSKTIVVIDDDASIRTALSRLLRASGFQVQTFESAEAFLATAGVAPACLVVDVHLPGMNGSELQERLGGIFPVVAISGFGEDMTRKRALEAGAAAFLHKPFADAELIGAIERAVAK